MISCFSSAFLLLSATFSGVFGEDEPRRNYRLEDFLWSGSGDGEGSGGGSGTSWATTTVFKTTTVLTTVYPTPIMPATTSLCSSTLCSITPSPVVTSTPVLQSPSYDNVPDQKYWLVTVIRLGDTVTPPNAAVIEQKLARLYTIAFHRQQERHLGLELLNGGKRERRETVSVRVHRLGSNGKPKTGRLQIVYTVRLAGRAVDAVVASRDMGLLAEDEVASLLGFPVLTKAEPFLKSSVLPLETSNVREIWLIVGACISTLLLIILLVLLFLLLVAKKKKDSSPFLHTTPFDRDKSSTAVVNMGFQEDNHQPKTPKKKTAVDEDSISSGNIDSIDGDNEKASPSRQPHRPSTAQKKPSSPNSYLSMPSVKAFPRGAPIPGPLEKVLDPTLSRHSSASVDPGVVGPLVWDLHCHRLNKKENDDTDVEPSVGRMRRRFHELLDDAFSLFGSRSGTPDEDEKSPAHNIYGRAKSAVFMPADSLESEKSDSNRPKTTDGRPGSASVGPRGAWASTPDPSSTTVLPKRGGRGPPSTRFRATPPSTSQRGGDRQSSNAASSMRSTPSPALSGSRAVPRPLSAGPFHRPTLEPAWILTDSSLKPTDPAVPLIEAIKKELDKFPTASHGSGSQK